jgi:hypothetical protein
MNTYLDALIHQLEQEEEEARAHPKVASLASASQRKNLHVQYLKRIEQRLATLRQLQASERKREKPLRVPARRRARTQLQAQTAV